MALIVLTVLFRYFVEFPSIWVCLVYFSPLDWDYELLENIQMMCLFHHFMSGVYYNQLESRDDFVGT